VEIDTEEGRVNIDGMEPAEKTVQAVIKLAVVGLALIVCLACFMAGHGFAGVVVFAVGIAFVMFGPGTRKTL
jgi:hypothetical protein